MRKVINDSGANVLGVFMGHNHKNDARSAEEVKGWPAVPENNWYKVPLEIEPSRGDLVIEDGVKLTRGTGSGICSGNGIAGTWDWNAGTFCYSPSSGLPSDHQVDVIGRLDDYAVNYYEILSSSGSTEASPTKGDESGAIVEVTGTDKTGVVIHGFAEAANHHMPHSAYVDESGKDRWDPNGANDTFSSGSLYDPYPTITYADAKTSSSSMPVNILIKSGRIRESGAIYPKAGDPDAERIWTCESGALITNSKDISNHSWSGPDANGWYALTLTNVGTLIEDNIAIPKFTGNATLTASSSSPQWDLEGDTLYYKPSSGLPSDHLVEAGTESSVLRPISGRDHIIFEGPCVFYGARYWGIALFGSYNNINITGAVSEKNGIAGFYLSDATFSNSSFKNITSRHNNQYGFDIRGNSNLEFHYILAHDNSSAGLYTHSNFTGPGASLIVHNATIIKNNTGIHLNGSGDTGGRAYTLENILVDSPGSHGIRVTAASASGAMTNSFVNQHSGTNVWGPLDHSDAVVEGTSPGLVDAAGNDFRPDQLSGCVDSGKVIAGVTKDIAGDPVYGRPDIGAYEYQPPYITGTDAMDTAGNERIYSDGKFRHTDAAKGINADLSITPQGGFGTGNYSEWMDIAIISWNSFEDNQYMWTETAALGPTVTTHSIGDLLANSYYSIMIDGVQADSTNITGPLCNNNGTCLSSSQGRVLFYYSGTYSFHTFMMYTIEPQDADSDGYTPLSGDCNDLDPAINPEAAELCDLIDNNCDGNIDEGYTDADGDGYPVCAGDCDDSNPSINPGSPEAPYDGIDQDCSGTDLTDVDDDGYDAVVAGGNDCDDSSEFIHPSTNWYNDSDQDGFGIITVSLQQCRQPAGYVLDNSDCDDNDPNIYPGGPHVRITGSTNNYYSTIQGAFDAAGDGDTIQSRDLEFTENIFLNVNISTALKTGYNCDYTSPLGTTTINGNAMISNGSLIIDSGTLRLQ
jgi:hypothetical protein